MNLGQLVKLVRAEYLVDATVNKIQGRRSSVGDRQQARASSRASLLQRSAHEHGRGLDPTSKPLSRKTSSRIKTSLVPRLRRLRDSRAGARVLPDLGIPRERSSSSPVSAARALPVLREHVRLHTHHGRARRSRPGSKRHAPSSRWVVTGDGDALSIAGNHLIHVLRATSTSTF